MQYGERFVVDRALPDPGVGRERLEGLFREAVPIYQGMRLQAAVMIASKAAAANATNLEAATTAHGIIEKAWGTCHSQFRGKAPDGSFRFKTK